MVFHDYQTQSEADSLRRRLGSSTPPHHPSSPVKGRPPSPPPRSSAGRTPSPHGNVSGGGRGRGESGFSPSQRQGSGSGSSSDGHPHSSAPKDGGGSHGDRDRSRVSPSSGDKPATSSVLSPDNPSSDLGSEYDDVDYVDEQESEPGDVDFAGVTSDIEVQYIKSNKRTS